MNLLLLKIRASKYFILLIALVLSNNLFANDSIPNNKFREYCKKADAYLLHSYTDVSYSKSWSRYKKQTSINNKLVINNNSGVDKYAFLNLTQFISNNLKQIQVKTLKADGTIVELDSSLVFQGKSDRKKFGAINYPVPGVEPGDTIETSYVYTQYLNKNELKDFVYLYTNIPSLNTEYTVRSKPDLMVRYKQYNNFPEPNMISNDTLIYSAFKMEKIKGLAENENTCLPCELPYVYYSLEKNKSELRTWMDVYNQEFNIITQPISFDTEKSSYYRKWKRKVIGDAKDSTKYYKLKLLHHDIITNIQMELANQNELIKSSGYFLKEKRFNPFSIRRLYRQILEDLEIDYSAVFARSKRSGNIDPYYIRKGEFDHIFFAYENGNGSLSLLYPHDAHYKYLINEIPTSLYNTKAVIVKPHLAQKISKKDKFINYDLKLAEVDSVNVNIVNLSGMDADRNYLRQVYYGKVNQKEKNASFKYRFSISGGLSTDIRSFFDMLDENKEMSDFYDALTEFEGNDNTLQIDSITSKRLKNKPPFTYTVNANATINGALTFLNDSIVSISLDNLVQHKQIESDDAVTDLNYYLDYSYTDSCLIMVDFQCDIEILGIENDKVNFKNDYGEYFFDIKKVGKTKLSLHSNYKIIKDMIPKNDFNQLSNINKKVRETKNKRLIVKLKIK